MKKDPTSLDLLHDIITAEPAPFWPPAPGWIGVLAVISLLVLTGLVWMIIHRQQNRYRHEALSELARLETLAAASDNQYEAVCNMSVLLKRTALTAFPRPEVATLSGTAWFTFLDSTGGTGFTKGHGEALESAIYQTTDHPLNHAQFTELVSEIRRWIREHDSTAELNLPGSPKAVSPSSLPPGKSPASKEVV